MRARWRRRTAVAAGLIHYLEHHIPEEMHGDEPGGELLEDLAAVGVDTARFASDRSRRRSLR